MGEKYEDEARYLKTSDEHKRSESAGTTRKRDGTAQSGPDRFRRCIQASRWKACGDDIHVPEWAPKAVDEMQLERRRKTNNAQACLRKRPLWLHVRPLGVD